jgi:hypothetical protein
MKRFTLMATMGLVLLGGGWVAAQTPAPKADEHAAHHPDKAAPGGAAAEADSPGGMGHGMGGHDKGKGMMGEGMGGMMGMCPMMGGEAKVEVKKLAKGVTITLTSEDAKEVARIQKMAEGMRLMHEAHAK